MGSVCVPSGGILCRVRVAMVGAACAGCLCSGRGLRARPVHLCRVWTCLLWGYSQQPPPAPPPSSLRLSHYSDICARHVPARSNLLRRN